MADTNEWRPKVGESVMVRGVVMRVSDGRRDSVLLQTDGTKSNEWFWPADITPATPTAREPWEVLNEAADVLEADCIPDVAGSLTRRLRERSARLEAAARPAPPPTLAEAVRGWVNWRNGGPGEHENHVKNIEEALARAEAEQ